MLWIATTLAVLVAFFAVLFTGRWPEGVHAFVLKCARWFLWFSAYAALLTDEYPPFSIDPHPTVAPAI